MSGPRCEIQWIDAQGEPTPDTNEAVVMVQCLGFKTTANPNPTPSKWFPCCAEHLKRIPNTGGWIIRPLPPENVAIMPGVLVLRGCDGCGSGGVPEGEYFCPRCKQRRR